jgi:hypothetical protein
MNLRQFRSAKIALAGGDSLTVRSNNPKVVPNDFGTTTWMGQLRVFELFPQYAGTTMLEARRSDGTVATTLQVQVMQLPSGTAGHQNWVKLASPQAALNSPNAGRVFRMKYSHVVPWDWGIDRMLDWIPAGVRHLIFNCHGIPTGAKADFPVPHLSIGTAVHPGNVGAFAKLKSRNELGVIWLSSCNVADGGPGNDFCAAMAKYSGCYVSAHQGPVADPVLRTEHIQDYDRSMPIYFNPNGTKLGRGEFYAVGRDWGFEHL